MWLLYAKPLTALKILYHIIKILSIPFLVLYKKDTLLKVFFDLHFRKFESLHYLGKKTAYKIPLSVICDNKKGATRVAP